MDKNLSFNLTGNTCTISFEKEVKRLGETIEFELKFKSHISNICNMASKQLNILVLKRKYLTRLGKLILYYSYILSNLTFVHSVGTSVEKIIQTK